MGLPDLRQLKPLLTLHNLCLWTYDPCLWTYDSPFSDCGVGCTQLCPKKQKQGELLHRLLNIPPCGDG